ncbi:MAG: PEP-CTERM sorting domain-containing protein [Acidobacteriaceae bacterium]
MKLNQIFGMRTIRNNRFACLAVLVLAGMVSTAASARADDFTFTINGSGITGSGISGSGILQVSNTGPFGAYTVTGISGTFTDLTNNISGAISGLESAGAPMTDGVDTFFSAPAATASNLTYDNLFWPGGNSPAVCVDVPAYFGGDFDIYGLAFDVAEGSTTYTVDLWSDGPDLGGYQLNDALNSQPFTTPNMDGLADSINFTASQTPEPSSLLLLGSGMLGFCGTVGRKALASKRWKR